MVAFSNEKITTFLAISNKAYMGKFDKKEACEYCEEKMEAKYRNKRFCSAKCRVYWNRENKKKQKQNAEPIKKANQDLEKTSFWEKMRNKRLGIK